jgi:hypothetical protein
MGTIVTTAFTLLGIAVGVLFSWEHGPGMQFALACFGAVVALPIGAGLASLLGFLLRRSSPSGTKFDADEKQHEDALQDNYWLDRGRLTGAPGLPQADDLDSTSGEP